MDISQIYREYPHLRIGYGGGYRAACIGCSCCRQPTAAKYRVAEQLTNREVECIVPPELAQQAADAAAEKRQVVMSGQLHRNEDGARKSEWR